MKYATLAFLGLVSADVHGPKKISQDRWNNWMRYFDEQSYGAYSQQSKDALTISKPGDVMSDFHCGDNSECNWDTTGNYCCGFIEFWLPEAGVADGGEYLVSTRCGDVSTAPREWSPMTYLGVENYVQVRCVDNEAQGYLLQLRTQYCEKYPEICYPDQAGTNDMGADNMNETMHHGNSTHMDGEMHHGNSTDMDMGDHADHMGGDMHHDDHMDHDEDDMEMEMEGSASWSYGPVSVEFKEEDSAKFLAAGASLVALATLM